MTIIKKAFSIIFIATHLCAATYELPSAGSRTAIEAAVKSLYYNDQDLRGNTELISILESLSLNWVNLCLAPQTCRLQVSLKRTIENPQYRGKLIQFGQVNLIIFLAEPRVLFITSKFTYTQGESLDSLVIDKPIVRIFSESK